MPAGKIAQTNQGADQPPAAIKIGLVGPCAAGKSTLAKSLRLLGLNIKHIAQEHSYVPQMWQIIARPDVLIYLDVSYARTLVRRKLDWSEQEYNEELRRLEHARQHADLVIHTDDLSPEQVAQVVLDFLAGARG